MDLHIDRLVAEPQVPLRIWVNSQLRAEIILDETLTARDWLAEITAARAFQALASFVRTWQVHLRAARQIPDHAHKTPAARAAAFARGLEDGLCVATGPHPTEGSLPPRPPESSVAYGRGYEHGAAMARALALLPDPA